MNMVAEWEHYVKSFHLISVALLAVSMTACTDYVGEIDEAHNEYVNTTSVAEKQSSGCQCYISDNALFDYASKSNEPITWRVDACRQEYNFRASLDYSTSGAKEAGAVISYEAKEGWDYRVDVLITVGGPYFQTSVGLNIDVMDIDWSFVESLKCEPATVLGFDESSVITPIISDYTSSSAAKSSSSAMSSSSAKSSSSSSLVVSDKCGDLWCGIDVTTRVNTDFARDDDNAGYWYQYTDIADAGTSEFTYPSDIEKDEFGSFISPTVNIYNGIKASILFGDGYAYPYAGLAFEVADWGAGADISSWGGICLVYQTTIGFSIELGVEEEQTVTGYDNYMASVAKSSSITAKDFPWSQFMQTGWGKAVEQEDALAKVTTIRLRFSGTAGNGGDFFIQSIGRLGTCN